MYIKKKAVENFDQSTFHMMLQKRLIRSFKSKPDINVNASRVQYNPIVQHNNVRVLYEYTIPEDSITKKRPLRHECTLTVQRDIYGKVNYRQMCAAMTYDMNLVIKKVRKSYRKQEEEVS